MDRIGIIGAGAWGTALAITARRAGRQVVIQAHEADVVDAINNDHENTAFLPGVRLDANIRATADPAEAADADAVLLAVPAQYLRRVAEQAAVGWKADTPAIVCAKGIEHDTCALMHEVAAEALPDAVVSVLSGPSFAIEVARDLPTAVTFACPDSEIRQTMPGALGTRRFRIYSSNDVIGAEVGGAVKNVLAIACGIVEGRRLGDNARAALITRGLAEIARLASAKGARPETLMGLSGVGDLVLTCNNMQSRNFSLGVRLGCGEVLTEIMATRTAVTEGVFTAASVTELARRTGVDLPICAAVDAVLNAGAELDTTIAELLARPFKAEAAEY